MKAQTWKAEERTIARKFNSQRMLMTGTAEKADVIHPVFHIDVKVRQRWDVLKWYAELKESANKVNKIPILTLRQPGKKGRLCVMDFEHFVSLAKGAGFIAGGDANEMQAQ